MTMSPAFAIVDDSWEDRLLLARALETAFPGRPIVEFSEPERAIRSLGSSDLGALAALFVDIHMPTMTGFEFADAIAPPVAAQGAAPAVFVISHLVDPRDAARIDARSDMRGWLAKPVSPAVLRDAIDDPPAAASWMEGALRNSARSDAG